MAPSVAQHLQSGDTPSPISAAVTASHALYLFFATHASIAVTPLSGVSDNVNGNWAKVWDTGDTTDGAGHHWAVQLWELVGSKNAGGNISITLTGIPGTAYSTDVFEVAGADTTNPRDAPACAFEASVASDGSGNTTTPAPTTGAKSGDLVIVLMGGQAASNSGGLTAPASPYSSDGTVAPNFSSCAVADRGSTLTTSGEKPSAAFGGFFSGATGLAGATLCIQAPQTGQTLTPATPNVALAAVAPTWSPGTAILAPGALSLVLATVSPTLFLQGLVVAPSTPSIVLATVPPFLHHGVPPNPRISTGLPTYGSDITYPPTNATNDNYSDQWATTTLPAWLALDISTLSSAKRKNVLLLLDNETGNYLIGPAQGYPTTYQIQVSSAAGGGPPPADTDPSWQAIVNVTGAAVPRHMHLLGNLQSENWVRVRMTAIAASDGVLHVQAIDLFDASAGYADTIMIIGDSTTQEGGELLDPTTGAEFTGGPIARKINTAFPVHWPLIIAAGDGGMNVSWMASNLASLLAGFTGTFVVLQMGLNDANQQTDLTQPGNAGIVNLWYVNLLSCIDYALAHGFVPILGKIQWAYANPTTAGNAVVLNAKVEQALTVDRPQCLRGPDMYSAFLNQTSLIRSDHLHPTFGVGGGYELWQRTMAAAIVNNVYLAPAPDLFVLSPATPGMTLQPVGVAGWERIPTIVGPVGAVVTPPGFRGVVQVPSASLAVVQSPLGSRARVQGN